MKNRPLLWIITVLSLTATAQQGPESSQDRPTPPKGSSSRLEQVWSDLQSLFYNSSLHQKTQEESCADGEATACVRSARKALNRGDAANSIIYFELACILGRSDACRDLDRIRTQKQDEERRLTFEMKIEKAKCANKNPVSCRKLAIILEKMGDSDGSRAAFERACNLNNAASCLFLSIQERKSTGSLRANQYDRKYQSIVKTPQR